MTREQAQREREVRNAFCDGKKIQVRNKGGVWFDTDEWHEGFEHRVNPAPRFILADELDTADTAALDATSMSANGK